jgi:hypothetical protein
MLSCADLAGRHGRKLPVLKLVARLRCQSPNRAGRKCAGKRDLVTLVLGRERRKDFLVYQEITVLDDRMRMKD